MFSIPGVLAHLRLFSYNLDNSKNSFGCSFKKSALLRHNLWKNSPTPVFLPGEFQGQRSLLGCRLWGRTESDTTDAT